MNEAVLRKNEESPKKRRRISIKAVISIICTVAVIAAVLTVFINEGSLTPAAIRKTYNKLVKGVADATYHFDSGFEKTIVNLNDGVVAAAGSSGVIVYGSDGAEIDRDAFSTENPVITAKNGFGAVYDIGGKSLRLIDDTGIITSMTFDRNIISCTVSTGGLIGGNRILGVCTEGADEYKGQVTFYRLRGEITEKIYDWYSGEGYTLSAAISPDNEQFAVLTISPKGGRVVLLDPTSVDSLGEYTYTGALIAEMTFMKSGLIIGRTAENLIAIDKMGNGSVVYDFEGRDLQGYSSDGDMFTAMYFKSLDSGGELVTVDEKGVEFGKMRTSRNFVSVEAQGDRLAVLWSDGLDIYDRRLKLIASYSDGTGYLAAFPLGGSRALAFGSHEGRTFS